MVSSWRNRNPFALVYRSKTLGKYLQSSKNKVTITSLAKYMVELLFSFNTEYIQLNDQNSSKPNKIILNFIDRFISL
ncbi:hypothetical protein AQUCO_01400804v1 [Aquilegia coerulea]|uniref:Uncharacterized protein n=1 Tax=Aquilegia coerulea TaxID=218851 RepID=A0A2G5DYW5_AQUCA|nr:hypothetical protein AQUCO_01400804v1 [Aquilegia coerulea]